MKKAKVPVDCPETDPKQARCRSGWTY